MFSSLQRSDSSSKQRKQDDKAQLRQKAHAAIATERAKIKGPTEQMNSVANSTPWRYAAMGCIALPLGGVAGLAMTRWPSVGAGGMLAALGLGYYGGAQAHNMYVRKLQLDVAQTIDQSIATLTELDQKESRAINDYYNEISTLQKLREGLDIPDAAALESMEEQQTMTQAEMLDNKVDKIVAAYEQRKGRVA